MKQNYKPDLTDHEGVNFWERIYNSLQEIDAIDSALPIQCENHGRLQFVSSAEDFDRLSIEGGCDLPCNYRMDCGHTCLRPCHSQDSNHRNFPCTRLCNKKCNNGHECQKRCLDVFFVLLYSKQLFDSIRF